MRRTAAIGAGFAGLLLLGQARQRSIAMAYSVMELLTLAVAGAFGGVTYLLISQRRELYARVRKTMRR